MSTLRNSNRGASTIVVCSIKYCGEGKNRVNCNKETHGDVIKQTKQNKKNKQTNKKAPSLEGK